MLRNFLVDDDDSAFVRSFRPRRHVGQNIRDKNNGLEARRRSGIAINRARALEEQPESLVVGGKFNFSAILLVD